MAGHAECDSCAMTNYQPRTSAGATQMQQHEGLAPRPHERATPLASHYTTTTTAQAASKGVMKAAFSPCSQYDRRAGACFYGFIINHAIGCFIFNIVGIFLSGIFVCFFSFAVAFRYLLCLVIHVTAVDWVTVHRRFCTRTRVSYIGQ